MKIFIVKIYPSGVDIGELWRAGDFGLKAKVKIRILERSNSRRSDRLFIEYCKVESQFPAFGCELGAAEVEAINSATH